MSKIYGTLNLSGASASPNGRRLQSTASGQLIALTKWTIYVFTPEPGISVDSHLLSSSRDGVGEITLFKSEIPLNKAPNRFWGVETPHWGAVAPGSVDFSWKDTTVSPLEIGPLLVTLDSNCEVALWASSEEGLLGGWETIQNITDNLYEHNSSDIHTSDSTSSERLQAVLQSQVTAIDWSPQILVEGPDPLYIDASLLALGSRAGIIYFLSYSELERKVNLIRSHNLSEDPISDLRWSSWRMIGPNEYSAFLCCTANGKVAVLHVQRLLESITFSLKVSQVEMGSDYPFGDGFVNALHWIEIGETDRVLVCTKPQTVYLWAAQSGHGSNLNWSGTKSITLRTQRVSLGSSACSPPSGFAYQEHDDTLAISLCEGTIHKIKCVCTNPVLHDTEREDGDDSLSLTVRRSFAKQEGREVPFEEMVKVMGLTSFDQSGTVAWLSEVWNPYNLDYRSSAERRCTLVLAEHAKLDLAVQIERAIGNIKSAMLRDTLTSLRMLFIHSNSLDPTVIFSIVAKGVTSQAHILPDLRDGSGPLMSEMTQVPGQLELRQSLTTCFHRSPELCQLRLRYVIASLYKGYQPVLEILSVLLSSLQAHIVNVVIKHIVVAGSSLSEADVLVVKHMRRLCTNPETASQLDTILRDLRIAASDSGTQGVQFVHLAIVGPDARVPCK